eukprot:TRINITY_DN36495_c0_g1_i1.p1 TRINITY_DN36495_c0_g1~~TRINITY_DN36495_c0_g1_i1.p1  ORF type:complete len:362 (-),score=32.92 TRINITY_DN36495_c0_g1_i1:8-1072(-)
MDFADTDACLIFLVRSLGEDWALVASAYRRYLRFIEAVQLRTPAVNSVIDDELLAAPDVLAARFRALRQRRLVSGTAPPRAESVLPSRFSVLERSLRAEREKIAAEVNQNLPSASETDAHANEDEDVEIFFSGHDWERDNTIPGETPEGADDPLMAAISQGDLEHLRRSLFGTRRHTRPSAAREDEYDPLSDDDMADVTTDYFRRLGAVLPQSNIGTDISRPDDLDAHIADVDLPAVLDALENHASRRSSYSPEDVAWHDGPRALPDPEECNGHRPSPPSLPMERADTVVRRGQANGPTRPVQHAPAPAPPSHRAPQPPQPSSPGNRSRWAVHEYSDSDDEDGPRDPRAARGRR